jgi:hypothetical protein
MSMLMKPAHQHVKNIVIFLYPYYYGEGEHSDKVTVTKSDRYWNPPQNRGTHKHKNTGLNFTPTENNADTYNILSELPTALNKPNYSNKITTM